MNTEEGMLLGKYRIEEVQEFVFLARPLTV